MFEKFYLIDDNKNKVYVEHYHLEDKNKKNKNSKKNEFFDKNIVVLCHGFLEHSNMKKYNELASFILDEGFEVIKFDFTGHGKSKGIVKVENFYYNIKRIYDYILKKGYKNISFVSYSISGIVILNFLKFLECKNNNYKNFIRKVVFLNPYFGYSKSKILKKNFFIRLYLKFFKTIKLYNKYENMTVFVDKNFLKHRKDLYEEFKSKKVFDLKTNTKIFIIHGKYDKNVPLKSSEIAYEELSKKGNFVLLYVVEDDHFLLKTKILVYKKIVHFLKV